MYKEREREAQGEGVWVGRVESGVEVEKQQKKPGQGRWIAADRCAAGPAGVYLMAKGADTVRRQSDHSSCCCCTAYVVVVVATLAIVSVKRDSQLETIKKY